MWWLWRVIAVVVVVDVVLVAVVVTAGSACAGWLADVPVRVIERLKRCPVATFYRHCSNHAGRHDIVVTNRDAHEVSWESLSVTFRQTFPRSNKCKARRLEFPSLRHPCHRM